jgi:hypothetical protein
MILPTDVITDLLSQLFECQLDRLPVELFAHQFANLSSIRPAFQCLQLSSGRLHPLQHCVMELLGTGGGLVRAV